MAIKHVVPGKTDGQLTAKARSSKIPPALQHPPREPWGVAVLRRGLRAPEHCHRGEAERGDRPQAPLGLREGIARIADQHIAAEPVTRRREAGRSRRRAASANVPKAAPGT